ncbi:MAG: DUF3488 and DUF4129 domain-containing transglutaminase family protein [Blastocatellia bacterium]
MNFNRYFIGSSYSLLVVSLAMLMAARRLDAVSLLLFIGAMAVGCLIDLEKLRWNLSRRWANGLMFFWMAVALTEWQVFRSSPITVIIHFVLLAAGLKLLSVKTNRDWLWLHLVTFCIVLMAAGMMLGTTFLVLLIVYLLAAASTFIAFEIRRSQQAFEREISARDITIELWRETKDQIRPLPPPRGRGLLFFSAASMALILVLAAPLFFVVPRVTRAGGQNSNRGLLQGEALSGFSDSVRLGEVGQIKLNPQVVMRVRVSFPQGQLLQRPPQSLRWRGITLDHYDGQTWNSSGPTPTPIRRIGDTFRLDAPDFLHGFTEQQFFMEPMEIRTVFAAPRPFLLSGLQDLTRDVGDGLWTDSYQYSKLAYSVYSDTWIPSDEQLAADNSRDYPVTLSKRYLQLPDGHDARITQLATKLTETAKTQLETIRRIEQHLRTQYDYSLDLQPVEDGDPVADFLFNARAGHCEYFASAMVLMLRARRIPARLVNGFQTGEYNTPADVFTVRQSDAHSWVEAYFPNHQWIAFDPTPAAGLSAYDGGLMAILRQYGEAMEMLWLEEVANFDTSKQISLFVSAQNWLSSYQRSVSKRWLEWTQNIGEQMDSWRGKRAPADGDESNKFDWRNAAWHPFALTLAGLLFVGLLLLQHKRFPFWKRTAKPTAAESAIRFYREMLNSLERTGHRRQPDQTPLEFAAQLAMPAVNELTQLYQRQRFSDATLTKEETVRIEMLLQDLKKDAKRK